MKTLLIDGDSARREELRCALELHDNEVVVAYDFEVASLIIKENDDFDLLIIRSTKGEGRQEIAIKDRARAKCPEIRVITTVDNTSLVGEGSNGSLPSYSVIHTNALTDYLKRFKVIK